MAPNTLPKIGIVHSGTSGKHEHQLNAFETSLAESGWIATGTSANCSIIDKLYGDNDGAKLRAHIKSLLNRGVKVLVAAGGTAVAQLAAQETLNAEPDVTKRTSVVFTSI